MKHIFLLSLFFCHFSLFAQENVNFQKPSAEILLLADYSRPPAISMSPDKSWVLFSYRPTYKSLEELGQEEVRLAGLRINGNSLISSTENYHNNLRLKSAITGDEFDIIGLPNNPLISNISFSPDGKKIAFTNTSDAGLALWIADVSSKNVKQITDYDLNAVLNDPYQWLNNSTGFLISKSPKNRPALIDRSKELPTGPVVSTSQGTVSQLRTYQDLLNNPQDEQDFESLATVELFWLDLEGKQTKFLNGGMYTRASLSPNGKYVLVSQLRKPFSYVVSYQSFPQETNVFDVEGKLVAKVNETTVMEVRPKGFSSTLPGRRFLSWRGDVPSTLFFVQALDGGDANKPVEYRDELFTLEFPFTGSAKSLTKVKDRFSTIIWGTNQYALVNTGWYDTRNTKTFVMNPATGDLRLIIDRNTQDVYSNPGTIFRHANQFGVYTMYVN